MGTSSADDYQYPSQQGRDAGWPEDGSGDGRERGRMGMGAVGPYLLNGNRPNAARRHISEPAPALFFGQRSNWCAWVHPPER